MAARPTVSLEAPPGVRIETPAVWTPSLRELAWRVAADQPGEYDLRIAAPSTVTKRLSVTPFIVPRATERPAPAFWTQLQHPAEAPLPAESPIDAIAIAYPARAIDLFGVPLHWLVILFLFSTVFALACRRLFGVVI